jgi:bifunctional non-homologous end joining protein LigD
MQLRKPTAVAPPRAPRRRNVARFDMPSGAAHPVQSRPLIAGVAITTPSRPVYPGLGFAKIDLARYYEAVAPWLLNYAADRPLTLVRCEHGATRADALRSECKFLRHEPGWHRWVHQDIRRVHIQEEKKVGEYLVVDSVAGLVALAQGGIVELHCWNSKTSTLEQPDRFVLDLDPGPEVEWHQLVEAAMLVRERLAAIEIQAWPKLTGGKGVHVVAPFRPELDWASVYRVTHIIAESLVRDHGSLFTVRYEKAARRGRILIDYKRNHRAAVAIAAYSPRALPAGTVSAPVSWKELSSVASSGAQTVCTMRDVITRKYRDPWREFWSCDQSLKSRLVKRSKSVRN